MGEESLPPRRPPVAGWVIRGLDESPDRFGAVAAGGPGAFQPGDGRDRAESTVPPAPDGHR